MKQGPSDLALFWKVSDAFVYPRNLTANPNLHCGGENNIGVVDLLCYPYATKGEEKGKDRDIYINFSNDTETFITGKQPVNEGNRKIR